MKTGRKVDHLRFEYKENGNINYGYSFSFKTYAVLANGKEKNITGKKGLTIDCFGAIYKKGVIRINGYPERFSDDIIQLRASYQKNGKVFKKKIDIPFNYKGELNLDFSGLLGETGENGDGGGTALFFRWGKDGDDGETGGTGGKGDVLSVYIWKDPTSQKYKMRLENVTTASTYYYSFLDKGFGILFNINGGPGGMGGFGGNGGSGKDGDKSGKKIKLAGDGGNGGDGGYGGQGGTGGSIFIFLHPNAQQLRDKITIYNFGGPGGEGGGAGSAGIAGNPLEGQDPATDGIAGQPGTGGDEGFIGEVIQFSIEEFDPE